MRIDLCTPMRAPGVLELALGITPVRFGIPQPVRGMATDSREVRPGDLFLALPGEKTDGTRFLSEALSRGACALLLPPGVPLPAGNYSAFESQDPLQTLLRAAAFRRSFSAARVIAVSGSSGKTSIKDALFALLSEKETVQKSKGNHNSLLGMPLSLLSMEEADDFVLELGVNHPGEMERLSRVLSPDICVLTNIGTAHVGMFESPAALALEKAKIVCGLRPGGVLFCPEDLPKALFTGEKVIRFGTGESADCRVLSHHSDKNGIMADIVFGDGRINALSYPIPGRVGLTTLALCTAVGHFLGLSEEELRTGLASAGKTHPRMQTEKIGPFSLIDDSYNASPEAMAAAFESLSLKADGKPYGAVLGDMEELGSYSESLHDAVGEYAAKAGLSFLFLCGRYAKFTAAGARRGHMKEEAIRIFENDGAEQIACELLKTLPADAWILLKASHRAGLWRVKQALGRLV